MALTGRWREYWLLMRMDKPIGSLLLLWPTLWALWLAAAGHPPISVVLIFVIGTVLMRSAGCVMNDYADQDFDPHVERTKNRPLAARRVSKKEALLLAAGLSLIAFLLILPLNRLTLLLSVPALFLAASYPYTKRFLAIPQAYLGIAFGFGIPMGFAAITGTVPPAAWTMLLANIFWAIAYDTEYAMVDRNDDIRIGIHSSALLFGRYDVVATMLCHVMALVLLGLVGSVLHRHAFYYLGLAGAAVLMAYQYQMIRDRERMRCFAAFLQNNWVGAIIFAGIALDYWIAG
jgi:4-hydroxybenzoate polyprenyltransferase